MTDSPTVERPAWHARAIAWPDIHGWIPFLTVCCALLRGIPTNPLIVQAHPFRRRDALMYFFFLQLAVAGLYAGASFVYFAFRMGGAGHEFNGGSDDAAIWTLFTFLALVVAAPGLTFPINVLAFSSRWRDPDRLRELVLTAMHPREIAFGLFFWGALAGAILPLGGLLALIPSVSFIIAASADSHIDEVIPLFLATIPSAVGPLTAGLGSTILCVTSFRAHRWRAIFAVPALLVYHAVAYLYLMTGLTVFFHELGLFPDMPDMLGATLMLGGGTVILLLVAIRLIRNGFRFGPAMVFEDVLPTPLERLSLNAAYLQTRRDPELRRQCLRTLATASPIPWGATALVGAASLFCLSVIWCVLGGFASDSIVPLLSFAGLTAAFLLSVAVLPVYVSRRTGAPGCRLMSGALPGALARPLLPLSAGFGLALCGGSMAAGATLNDSVGGAIGTAMTSAGPLILIAYCQHAMVESLTGRLRLTVRVLQILAPLVAFSLYLTGTEETYYGEAFWNLRVNSVVGTAMLAAVIVYLLPVYLLPDTLSRIQRNRLACVSPGELEPLAATGTTAPPPVVAPSAGEDAMGVALGGGGSDDPGPRGGEP